MNKLRLVGLLIWNCLRHPLTDSVIVDGKIIDLKDGRNDQDLKDDQDRKYNDGYSHEALHTAHVLSDAWERHVVDTRCAAEYPEVKAAVEAAAEAMANAYQIIGQKLHESETPSS